MITTSESLVNNTPARLAIKTRSAYTKVWILLASVKEDSALSSLTQIKRCIMENRGCVLCFTFTNQDGEVTGVILQPRFNYQPYEGEPKQLCKEKGATSCECEQVTVGSRGCRATQDLFDTSFSLIPDHIMPESVLDKREIRKHLSAGSEVPIGNVPNTPSIL